MNKIEAKEILSEQITRLKRLSYTELLKFFGPVNIKVLELAGKSGKKYQVEIKSFWDDKPNQNLRVSVSIDDGGWRAWVPITDSFIVSPKANSFDDKGETNAI